MPVISEFSPPITPPIAIGFSASQIMSIESSSNLSFPSRVVNLCPASALRTTILPWDNLSKSKP